MIKTFHSKALEYAVRGYSVMPVKKDKRPFLSSWKQYQTTPADDDQIETWWEKNPDANIGIITGKVSGIIVIDVDTYNGASPAPFPETYTVRTGQGGLQLYYKYVEGFTISANGYSQFPFVDIRSDGGYVVAPPSETSFVKNGKTVGGKYTILKNLPIADFPIHLFPKTKTKRTLSQTIGTQSGSRNDSITSLIGRFLTASKESDWESEVYPIVQRANKTYQPPLPEAELLTTFNSIVKKEKERRSKLIISPIQMGDQEIDINMRRATNGTPYKDMANVLAVLEQHPFYKDSIRYNEFKQEIEYNGKSLEESDLVKIQYFMQADAKLNGISKEAVYSAIQYYANKNKYDEAQDWVRSLSWDGIPRLSSWISQSTSLPNDDYLEGIGSQWFMGLIRRIMRPGSIFDYMLVLVGPQGIGKTSFFRIIGGPWYKSYTGAIDNKDFYLALRGAVVMDLDEGAALQKSEAIKMKSIITETHDEYRAPYDRVMKKYPRRFVFSMSTNDTEPFRDVTGNRRYWPINATEQVNFKWLEDNRDQIFAETYYYYKNEIEIPEVPKMKALENQETHLPDDSWTDLVVKEIRKSEMYCRGDIDYSTTIIDIFMKIFPNESVARLTRGQEMRIATIFKKEIGLEKRRTMIDGQRKVLWLLTPQKMKELQEKNVINTDKDLIDF